jgi:hypothetical protein
MFIAKLKNWLVGLDDVTVDIARANYRKYENQLKMMQCAYIRGLCDQIKNEARYGKKSITTVDTCYDFFTYEFMEEVKNYFEQRGFDVKEESNRTGVLKSWLRIRWD